MVAKIGSLPKGFIPDEVLVKFGLFRRLEKGEFLVLQQLVHSSDASHTWDIEIYKKVFFIIIL